MNSFDTSGRERILIYDFHTSGHCPGWLYLVVSGFAVHSDVLVCCQPDHPEVSPWIKKLAETGGSIEVRQCDPMRPARNAASVARSEGIKKVFFPNFDSVIYSIGRDRVPGVFANLDIAGIWLRPDLLDSSKGFFPKVFSRFDRTRRGKLKRQNMRAVRNNRSGLSDILEEGNAASTLNLFFTSPESAAEAEPFLNNRNTHLICDPWLNRTEISKREARQRLGISEEKTVFLHAGTSRPEKGLRDSCEAMMQMEGGILDQACLLRAGKVDAKDSASLERLKSFGSAVIIDRYVSEEELAHCYAACDWVLLPYRNQKESSGILIHAAANDRPVIASDFGLIAENTKRYGLGLVFRHLDTSAFSEILQDILNGRSIPPMKKETGMREFARINSPMEFQRILCENWLKILRD